jgi:uncharacterized protein YeaO (DUF488 family)
MAGERIRVRRVYEEPDPGDGTRVLVDRIWPRGLTKARAALNEWCKNVAPSNELRKWYSHDPDRFEDFGRRYRAELKDPRRADALAHLSELAAAGQLTLLTATRHPEISEAAVLAALLQAGEQSRRTGGPAAGQIQPAKPGPPVLDEPAPADDIVHLCGLGSFPASDPPSWWAQADLS